ncbi:MAG: glucosyltransferase domain-containing protein, partial [Lachnospiraceae bacterium]|nr:glucosyltransferase domain-containing protein [Lachnospiraceae bacterium]
SILYLSLTAVFTVKLLKVKTPLFIGLISGLLVTFPVLASNFAYAFTMDGYMMGLLFAVLSVYLVSRFKWGFIAGGIVLALSMGIYQAYLPVAMLLSLYMVLMILAEKTGLADKVKRSLNYLYMGIIGAGLYYVILKVLLAITGRELDTYQGISSATERASLTATLKTVYVDFVSFTLKGRILFNNPIALIAVCVLAVSFAVALFVKAKRENWFKSVWFYIVVIVTLVLVPLFTNIILFISKDVTYHALMRYQWVVFGVLAVGFVESVLTESEATLENVLEWCAVLSAAVIVFANILSVNVGYFNLEKKYEKTYSYCVRLADRIEQTEGYYQGIPIYMIGVVGDDNFPKTDITEDVTDHMLGINGEWLLYTPANYEAFYKHYLGITFNFLRPEEANYYDSAEYVEMPSFPATGSTKVVDGVLYVKTENMH